MRKKLIFHCDVDAAYLSWQAVYNLQHGIKTDLRRIPCVVGGDPKKRSGIVLAKSGPAKKYGIQTGEVLWKAMQKCPTLTVVPPNYSLYLKCSKAMNAILKEYAPRVQPYSIDESFCDFTGTSQIYSDPVDLANTIRKRVNDELGFTVSLGVSENKLLSKMATELKKPNGVDTIWKDEIRDKMWPLPIRDLFGVGSSTEKKLKSQGILKIGDLASMDPKFIQYKLGKYGLQIWNYANGYEDSMIRETHSAIKGIGNSSTLPRDIDDRKSAHLFILSLTEMVAMRLRHSGHLCNLISVSIRYADLSSVSHQQKLFYNTKSTNDIYKVACRLFDDLWNGQPFRHLGVRVSKFSDASVEQLPLLNSAQYECNQKLDQVIDELRDRFGKSSVMRGAFLHSGVRPITGGIDSDYPVVSNIL